MAVGYGSNLIQGAVQASTQQTDTTIVSGVTGRKIKVAYVFVAVDTSMTVTLEDGTTTRKWELYPAANGGAEAEAPEGQFLFETSAGNPLTFTTSGTGNVFVSVLYEVE